MSRISKALNVLVQIANDCSQCAEEASQEKGIFSAGEARAWTATEKRVRSVIDILQKKKVRK